MKTSDKNLINRAYVALDCLNNIKMSSYRDNLFDLCAKEERGHRRFNTGYYGCSVADAARMFVVRDICAQLNGTDPKLTMADYLTYKQSLFMAASLVANYREEITKALDADGLTPHLVELAELDYCLVIA